MIPRQLSQKLLEDIKYYPIITLTGPRQSGKTTLAQAIFFHKKYVTLENHDEQEFALKDPKGFLAQFPDGAIIDEAQRAPKLFSYIQGIVDNKKETGLFILLGSQNFLLLGPVTQSLAGRTSILKLLPFSLLELKNKNLLSDKLDHNIFKGFYPRIYDQNIKPASWYSNYLETYLERDIRTLKQVSNLSLFHKFLKLCAGRAGQILNYSSIGNDCGISHNTVRQWISLLETSFIVYLLPPYYKNFNKRVIKAPKLYFYDTGLLCHLLEIKQPDYLANHYLRGAIFENFILGEMTKHYTNKGERPSLYYWRDKTGHEIDCLISEGEKLIPMEIKSSQTFNKDFYKNIEYFNKLSNNNQEKIVILASDHSQQRTDAKIVSWLFINEFLASIFI